MSTLEKIYIGIDPGMKGAVVVLGHNYEPQVIDTPTTIVKSGKRKKEYYIESEMANIMRKFSGITHNVVVAIEKSRPMQGQGVVSMYSTGLGYGLWLGILSAFKIPYVEISPQAWKKEMMKGMGKEKAASCYRAQQLFPEVEVFGPKGGAIDGRGDALLIAEYSRRNNF